jgi:hypothetical protein
MTFNGHTLFTDAQGQFRVAVLLRDGTTAVTDPNRYVSEATATLAAKKAHSERPHMNYVVVRQ